MEPDGKYERIYSVVRRIPRRRVSTYGWVAAGAGLPGHARLVGYALHAVPDHSAVPWHRVVNVRGAISTRRSEPGGAVLQRLRLEEEGVGFDARGRIPLERFGWRPAPSAPADPAPADGVSRGPAAAAEGKNPRRRRA